ncbi:MAG: iron ABC transporter permease [Oligoflexales bacterium]|nr:iron ABC transporter permease [Oligoflexales bacterium]
MQERNSAQFFRCLVQIPILVFAIISLLSIAVIFVSWTKIDYSLWNHIVDTMLVTSIVQTLAYPLIITFISSSIGILLAWWVSFYRFPGRPVFIWLLAAPLIIPAYIFAFVYVGLFEFSGPIFTFVRNNFSFSDIFAIRAPWAYIMIMSLSLYPYVYLISLQCFRSSNRQLIEAANLVGATPKNIFQQIALPGAKPWLLGGMSIIFLESLSDFGAASVFSINNLSTLIYKTWNQHFSFATAAQLSSILIFFSSLIIVLRKKSDHQLRYLNESLDQSSFFFSSNKNKLRWMALVCSFFVFMGFIMPITQLIIWSRDQINLSQIHDAFTLTKNSLMIAIAVGLFLCFLAYSAVLSQRFFKNWATSVASTISCFGYGIPGTVFAVAAFLTIDYLTKIGNNFASFFSAPNFLISFTLLPLFLGLSLRFFNVAFIGQSSAIQRISKDQEQSALSLGANIFSISRHIISPQLFLPFLTAFSLVTIDILKEMPMTLMLRPFSWDTLAVRIYEYSSEGDWAKAALPALFLIVIASCSLLFLHKNYRE